MTKTLLNNVTLSDILVLVFICCCIIVLYNDIFVQN